MLINLKIHIIHYMIMCTLMVVFYYISFTMILYLTVTSYTVATNHFHKRNISTQLHFPANGVGV